MTVDSGSIPPRPVGRPKGQNNNDRWYGKEAKKAALLEALKHTPVLRNAIVEIGWSEPSYHAARKNDPTFGAKVDAIRGSTGAPMRNKRWREAKEEREAALADIEERQRAIAAKAVRNGLISPANWSGFAEFRQVFFGHESPWFHLRAVDALENGAPGSVTMILWHPGSGKTTTLEDYLSFKFATDPEFRAIVGSERQAHGVKIARRLMLRMTPDGSAAAYAQIFGPFEPQTGEDRHPQAWTRTHFDVWKRQNSDERDYNLSTAGIGSAVAGSRCDLLILDDVQSLKSLNATDKIFEEFRQDWLSRPMGSDPPGRTVILGTRVGEGDIYERLIEEGLVDKLIKFPARDHDGNILWPERYSDEQYKIFEKQVGPQAWARNWMQQPILAGDRTFTKTMLDDCTNPMRRIGGNPPDGVKAAAIGWDPGFGTNAFFVAGLHADRFVALDWRRDHDLSSTKQMAAILEDLCFQWRERGVVIAHLVIEDKAFQHGLLQDDSVLEVQRRYGFSISGHQTGSSKHDAEFGIAAMARTFHLREMDLPGGDDLGTQRARAELDAELLSWRPDRRGTKLRQDLVIALWFSWMRWKATRSRSDTLDRSNVIRTSGLGMKPTAFNPTPLVGAFR